MTWLPCGGPQWNDHGMPVWPRHHGHLHAVGVPQRCRREHLDWRAGRDLAARPHQHDPVREGHHAVPSGRAGSSGELLIVEAEHDVLGRCPECDGAA